MGIVNEIIDSYGKYFDVSLNQFLINLFIAIGLILLGVFLGNVVAFGLKKISKHLDISKKIRPSFVGLIIVVIKWAIYIIFIDLALVQLPIRGLTTAITGVLVVIPALVASLIIIFIGFGIGTYLRDVVRESGIGGWRTLSLYLYYFILFVFGIYSLKVALISMDSFVVNWIIIVCSSLFVLGLIYMIIKKEIRIYDEPNKSQE